MSGSKMLKRMINNAEPLCNYNNIIQYQYALNKLDKFKPEKDKEKLVIKDENKMSGSKMFSNEEIKVIKQKNVVVCKNEKNEKNMLIIDDYYDSMICDFNNERIKSSYTDKIVIYNERHIGDEINLYNKALEKFKIDLKENNYYIKKIKRDKTYDSCAYIHETGYYITVVSDNYKEKPKTILEKLYDLVF